MQPLLSGVFTVADDTLFAHLVQVLDATGAGDCFTAAFAVARFAEGRGRWLRYRLPPSRPWPMRRCWTPPRPTPVPPPPEAPPVVFDDPSPMDTPAPPPAPPNDGSVRAVRYGNYFSKFI